MKSNFKDKYILNLHFKTLCKPIMGLFDYESLGIESSNIVLEDSACLLRIYLDIITLDKNPFMLEKDERYLFSFKNDVKNEFILENAVPIKIQPYKNI